MVRSLTPAGRAAFFLGVAALAGCQPAAPAAKEAGPNPIYAELHQAVREYRTVSQDRYPSASAWQSQLQPYAKSKLDAVEGICYNAALSDVSAITVRKPEVVVLFFSCTKKSAPRAGGLPDLAQPPGEVVMAFGDGSVRTAHPEFKGREFLWDPRRISPDL